MARARVLAKLTALAKQATGSSQRVLRLSFLTRPLSIDAGEVTEKGSISQRGIVRRHPDLVEELYADKPSNNILCAGFVRKPCIGREQRSEAETNLERVKCFK